MAAWLAGWLPCEVIVCDMTPQPCLQTNTNKANQKLYLNGNLYSEQNSTSVYLFYFNCE